LITELLLGFVLKKRGVFGLITELLLGFVLNVISSLGLAGIALLMLLESTLFPIPSELVMPFAGFLVSEGKLEFFQVVIAATLGSIAGSLISYYIGKIIGRTAVERIGKYFLVKKKHLGKAHEWFEKFGSKTIFFCRFIPVIRHVISIPAGIAEMNFGKFIAYTAIGAFLWNAILTIAGMQLGKNWAEISKYSGILDIVIVVAIIAGIVWILARKTRKTKV
jgi:membrane protein DedA with SNARE-associated domain